MKTLIYTIGLMLSLTAFSEDLVDKRQELQEKRIEKGVENGSLTEHEAKKLERQQDRIEKREEQFRSDGQLSPSEKARLNRQQNRANHNIFRKKHNARKSR